MGYLFIGLGGAFGALARFILSKWVKKNWCHAFPLGTFIANLIGSFALGFLFIMYNGSCGNASLYMRNFISVGFLGALTTYSTFSFEIIELIEKGQVSTGLLYMVSSVILGLLASFLAIFLAGEVL